MFVCRECETVFEEPKFWEEKHGLDTPPYELMSGCPECYGDYTEAHRCKCCGEYITDSYFKVEDARYCQDCCIKYELGDED